MTIRFPWSKAIADAGLPVGSLWQENNPRVGLIANVEGSVVPRVSGITVFGAVAQYIAAARPESG